MDHAVDVRVHLTPADRHRRLLEDARVGLLSAGAKELPPIWFYDERGSALFEQITRLPEYYPTRTERSILAERSEEIAKLVAADTLVELGSGSSEKTLLLLDAMAAAGGLARFVPFDVSAEPLRAAAVHVQERYGLEVTAVVGDFHQHLSAIPRGGRRLIAFLGGTIGNLRPAERSRFFAALRATMRPGDAFLLGADLLKDAERLIAAYDDPAGVTAAFNRNLLAVLNRELRADFDPERFEHVACWNPDERWIEMRLRSTLRQRIRLTALSGAAEFTPGEELLTEISAKFSPEGLHDELRRAGFAVTGSWTDQAGDFLVTLADPSS